MNDGNGASTLPPPASGTLEEIRELRLALEASQELTARLINKLTLVEISTLTGEHRDHVQDARLDRLAEVSDDHERRLAAAEAR